MASDLNKGIINNFRLLMVLGLLYGLFLWAGYDRLPLLPISGDGALIQDPALALARGQGMRAPSFAGTLGFESLYAHHPPLYIYLQSWVLRWLGVTPLGLRLVSLSAAILALAAWLACFGLLLRLGWLDRLGFWLACLLYLVEPAVFSLGRWERMDSLANFLVASSVLLLLLVVSRTVTAQKPAASDWLGVALAFIMGLALSTHLASSVAWLVWACLFFALRENFKRPHAILVILLPWLILAAAWLAAYRSESLAALSQLWTISSHHAGGWLAYVLDIGLTMRSPRQLLQAAPLAGLSVLCAWLLAAIPVLAGFRHAQGSHRQPERYFLRWLWLGLTLSLLFLLFLAGFNPRHVVVLFPFALVAAGMALQQEAQKAAPRSRFIRRTAAFFAACLFIACLAVQALTFYSLASEWNERSPERFRKLSAEISQEAQVAALPEFWYFFQSKGQPVRVIDYGFPEDRLFWEAHAAAELPGFDYAILSAGHPLGDLVASLSLRQQELSFSGVTYILYTIK